MNKANAKLFRAHKILVDFKNKLQTEHNNDGNIEKYDWNLLQK